MTLDEVKAKLEEGVSLVTFFKLDGSIREMLCTRDMSIIPVEQHPKNEGNRSKSDTTVTVYAVKEGQWKSFVLENLTAIEKV